MRVVSPLLLALPALSAAQQQFPFLDQVKGFFAKASASISSAIPSAPSVAIPNPIASGAKKIASITVSPLTLANHRELLKAGGATASPGIEEWLIFVTGGNKTCYGSCTHAETAFNESVALISGVPRLSSPPNLAMLNCEVDGVLCWAWLVQAPQILHLLIPQPLADQSNPATIVRSIPVNRTSVTPSEIAALSLEEKYKATAPYEGIFHPFDSPLAKTGANIPMGYVMWGFSKIPSWAFMIGISIFSRQVMQRRAMGGTAAAPDGPAAPAGQ